MSQTIADTIRTAVFAHYSESDVALLLADLGKALREKGVWPPYNESRTLGQIIDAMAPEVKLIRDPSTPAYIAVVPAGKEHLANDAIERWRRSRSLMELPRSVLVAFCLRLPEGENVYVQTTSPFRYHIGKPSDMEGFALVESSYRIPGLFVGDPQMLSASDALALAEQIDGWAKYHNIQLTRQTGRAKTSSHIVASAPEAKKGENALERLYAAQPEGLGDKIVVPIDVAVYLSRLP